MAALRRLLQVFAHSGKPLNVKKRNGVLTGSAFAVSAISASAANRVGMRMVTIRPLRSPGYCFVSRFCRLPGWFEEGYRSVAGCGGAPWLSSPALAARRWVRLGSARGFTPDI